MDHEFPVYRKSANGRHFYRIESTRAFTEVQVVGQRAVIHRVREAAYPEQVRIEEMLNMHEGGFLPLRAAEFEHALDLHDGK